MSENVWRKIRIWKKNSNLEKSSPMEQNSIYKKLILKTNFDLKKVLKKDVVKKLGRGVRLVR